MGVLQDSTLGLGYGPRLGVSPSRTPPRTWRPLRLRWGCTIRGWHLVALGPWATGLAGLDAVGLVGFQDGVRRAGVAGPCVPVNVEASRAGGTGGAHV